MLERDRVKLLFGSYRMPRCRVDRFLKCLMRGEVPVHGIHDAHIQWPYTLQKPCGRRLLILCGDLARALVGRCQAHGLAMAEVLGVEFANKGTSDLLRHQAPECCQGEKAYARCALSAEESRARREDRCFQKGQAVAVSRY